MNIDLLHFFDPQDSYGWSLFLGGHGFAHSTIAAQVTTKYLQTLSHYPLTSVDREDPSSVRSWLLAHNNEHQAINAILGLGTPADLSELDINNKEQFESWMYTHMSLHSQIVSILGI